MYDPGDFTGEETEGQRRWDNLLQTRKHKSQYSNPVLLIPEPRLLYFLICPKIIGI